MIALGATKWESIRLAVIPYASSGIVGGAKVLTVASSIGALTSMLYQLQGDERGRIIEHLATFDSPDIRDAFTKLFKAEGGAYENNSLLQ